MRKDETGFYKILRRGNNIIIIASANHSYLQPRGLTCEGHSSDGIGRMHMKGASGCRQTAMHDPGAQHPGQMFLTGSRFWRGRKTGEKVRLRSTETQKKVRLRSTETQLTNDRIGGMRK